MAKAQRLLNLAAPRAFARPEDAMVEDKNPKRIFVVDDERSIANTLAAIFRMSGFDCKAVYSGGEAISIAATFRPDILLSDYSMPPGMNGIESAIAIKKLLPGCRIIMLSGQLLTDHIAPFSSKGYNFLLLSKPMHPGDLLGNCRSLGFRTKDRVQLKLIARITALFNASEFQRYPTARSRIPPQV